MVACFALEGDFDPATLEGNFVEIECPPSSGKMQRFAEVDRAAWFGPAEARIRINPAQSALIDRLLTVLDV